MLLVILSIMILFLIFLVSRAYGKDRTNREIFTPSSVWNVDHSNQFFIERKAALRDLDEMLKQHDKIAIIGVGGTGKTQLAKKIARDKSQQYEIIWWFDADLNLEKEFEKLAQALMQQNIGDFKIDLNKTSAEAVVLYVQNILRTTNKSWLIIFDNVKQTEDIQKYMPETHNKIDHRILITSRNANASLPFFTLRSFNQEEALEFLSKALPQSDINELKELAELLYSFPFALAQVASHIQTDKLRIPKYIADYKKNKKQLWQYERSFLRTNNDVFDLEHRDLETILDLSLLSIEKESKAAITLLAVDSLMKRASIPETVLLNILIACGYSEEEFRIAVRSLKRYSLIEVQPRENDQYYVVHDIVKAKIEQDFAFTDASAASTKSPTNKIVRFVIGLKNVFNIIGINKNNQEFLYHKILGVFCNDLNKPWGEMISYVNSQAELINIANDFAFKAYKNKIQDPLLITLLVSLLEHNNMVFHLKSSYPRYKEQVAALFDLLEVQKIKVDKFIQAKVYLNSIYADSIYPSDHNAKFHEKKILESEQYLIQTQASIEDLFLAYIRLAEFFLNRGYANKSITYMDESYALLNEIQNINYQAQFWYVLTWLYLQKGDYLKANEYIKIFFKITKDKQIFPLHLYAMNLQGSLNFYLNNFAESLQLANECYNQANSFFQTKTSNVAAESLITLARTYNALGDLPQAKEKITEAIKTLDIVFGKEDVDFSQAVAHRLYGEMLEQQKEYKQAYYEYIFAENFYLMVYKDKLSQMREVSELFANIAILGIKINDFTLTRIYYRKLVEEFSIDNTNTQKVIEELQKHKIELSD